MCEKVKENSFQGSQKDPENCQNICNIGNIATSDEKKSITRTTIGFRDLSLFLQCRLGSDNERSTAEDLKNAKRNFGLYYNLSTLEFECKRGHLCKFITKTPFLENGSRDHVSVSRHRFSGLCQNVQTQYAGAVKK